MMPRIKILLMTLATPLACLCQTIVGGEYFFDIDPGFGEGNSIEVSAGSNIIENIAINTSTLSWGFHTLYFRFIDSDGYWTLTAIKSVEIQEQLFENTTIVSAEYFIDSDPGFGNGTAIPVNNSTTNANITFDVSPEYLEPFGLGIHRLFIRSLDNSGAWSHTAIRVFEKLGWQEDNLIVGAEYFFDVDPGIGEASYIPFNASFTNATDYILIPIVDVPSGNHTLYIRTLDANGAWSHTSILENNFSSVAFIEGELEQNDQTICNGAVPEGIGFATYPEAINNDITYQWWKKSGLITATGDTTGWTKIISATASDFVPSSALAGNTTFACWNSSANGDGWAEGQMQVTVLSALSYGSVLSGNQSLTSPADPSNIILGANPTGSGAFTYQWYKYSGLADALPANCSTADWQMIPNATTSSYNPPVITSNTSYACFITPSGNPDCGDGCWANGFRKITVLPVGLEEITAHTFLVYPNPFQHELTLEFTDGNQHELELLDAGGRKIRTIKNYINKQIIDTKTLESGIYFLTIPQSNLHPIKVIKTD